MDRYLNRKSFVTSLGVAGLGLGMSLAALGGATGALAQENESTPAVDAEQARASFEQMQTELYAAFTAALAEELGSGDAAQIDSGIRAALAAVVDGFAGDDLVTPGQATALKALVETAEVPIGPGPLMGHERLTVVRAISPADAQPAEDVAFAAVEGESPAGGRQAMADRFYPDFTAALATALGAGSADEVDGAIRVAMISVIDGLESDDLPMPIPTDALKAMVATAESPLGPGFLLGGHPGMVMRTFHGRGDDGPGFHRRGHGGDDGWFGERAEHRGEVIDDDAATDDENDDSEDEASG
jgi:hypothetical protein